MVAHNPKELGLNSRQLIGNADFGCVPPFFPYRNWVWQIRSDWEFLYKQGIFSNLPLLGAVLFTFGLQVLVIYLALANEVFKTQPLSFHELTIYIGASTVLFHAVELEKWVKSRFSKKNIHP